MVRKAEQNVKRAAHVALRAVRDAPAGVIVALRAVRDTLAGVIGALARCSYMRSNLRPWISDCLEGGCPQPPRV